MHFRQASYLYDMALSWLEKPTVLGEPYFSMADLTKNVGYCPNVFVICFWNQWALQRLPYIDLEYIVMSITITSILLLHSVKTAIVVSSRLALCSLSGRIINFFDPTGRRSGLAKAAPPYRKWRPTTFHCCGFFITHNKRQRQRWFRIKAAPTSIFQFIIVCFTMPNF